MGAVHPGLQVADRAMRAREQLVTGSDIGLRQPAMVIAVLGERSVGLQPVGVHDRSRLGGGLGEREQRRPRRVGQDCQAQAPGATAADLDRHAAEGLLPALAPAFEPFFVAAEEELVDLDLAREQGAFGGDHRGAQLVQHRPRGLVSTDAELALKLLALIPGWNVETR